jgi:hypothetical protein
MSHDIIKKWGYMMTDINEVWSRIKKHAGETFVQIKGAEFTYWVEGNHVYVDRTKQRIPKSNFEKALAFVPLKNTVPLQEKFRGPSFIFAILMDMRIRLNDW